MLVLLSAVKSYRAGLLPLLLLPALLAQEFRATLTGRVADPTNAPIPGVKIRVKNPETGEQWQALTDNAGNYTVLFLRPGAYSVTAEAESFKTITRDRIWLSVGQAATLDFRLELGSVTQEITVTADAPILDSASAERGGLIDEEMVKEFPLNGRNPFMLSMLVPGVNFNGNLTYQRPFDNGAIADWSINGSPNRSNEFLLDGAPNNAQAGGNNLAYVPPVDSVLEFKIQTNSYDAQYGRTAGGVVNVVLKSGTNRLHGSAYEFARRNTLDANSFQNNARGAPKEGHFLDQYGLQLDGPLYIPKLYDGRKKAFFLFNYEGYHEGTPQPLILSVPEPEMRDGDFSRLTDPKGRRITIYDPSGGEWVNNRYIRQPFPGNLIPADRINPISRRIVDYFPMPNTKTPGMEYSQQNYFISGGVNTATDDFYNLALKFDFNLSDSHHVFLRHGSNDRSEQRSFNGVMNRPGQDGQHPLKRVNDAYVVDWVGMLSPTIIMNVRSSFSRYVEGSRADANRGFDLMSLGFPESLVRQLPYGNFFGRYEISGYINLGKYFDRNVTNTFTVHPNVTKVRGSRTVKAGIDMRWIQYSRQNPANVFQLSSSKGFTQSDSQRADGISGNGLASWLLGTPSGGSVNYNEFPIYMYRYFAPWMQYDWKLSPRLTVNFGLRMDFNVPPNERFDRLNRSFDEDAVNPIDAMIDRARFPDFPTVRGTLLFAGVDGVPRSAANLYTRTVQPRLGFAYALTRKTVLRGGWGRYFINPNNDYLQTTGFSVSTPLIASLDEQRTALTNRINNPFPKVLVPRGAALGGLTFLGRGFNFVNADFRIPYVDQFSVGIQRAVSARSKFEISYAGNRGRKLQNSKPFNEDDVSFRDRCNYMLGGTPSFCDQYLPNPFYGLPPFEGTNMYTNPRASRGQLFRPFPQFTGLTELMRNDGASWYNSLQVLYVIRTKGGLNLNTNYTFAKQMERSGFLDALRRVQQQGLAAWDRPHRYVISSVYQLPFGRGRRWLNGIRGPAGKLINGWENTIIFQWQSGPPWNLPGNVIYLKDARMPGFTWEGTRLQALKPCILRWNEDNTITMQRFSQEWGCTEANWLIVPRFNPRYTPYRDPRVRLQATRMLDISLNKMTQITERLRVQFRAEAFNLTNSFFITRQHFDNNPESPNFGSLQKNAVSAPNSNYPRHIQLAVKLIW